MAEEIFRDRLRPVAGLGAERWPRERAGGFQSVRDRRDLVGLAVQAAKTSSRGKNEERAASGDVARLNLSRAT